MSDGEFQIWEEDDGFDEMNGFIPGNYFQGGRNLHHPIKSKPMTGVELIAQERLEQKVKHGRNVKFDYENNTQEELASMAAALILQNPHFIPDEWDQTICSYMMRKSQKERLIIAGALIAAEIDRLNYKE